MCEFTDARNVCAWTRTCMDLSRLCKDLSGFARICKDLFKISDDLRGFSNISKDLYGYVKVCKDW